MFCRKCRNIWWFQRIEAIQNVSHKAGSLSKMKSHADNIEIGEMDHVFLLTQHDWNYWTQMPTSNYWNYISLFESIMQLRCFNLCHIFLSDPNQTFSQTFSVGWFVNWNIYHWAQQTRSQSFSRLCFPWMPLQSICKTRWERSIILINTWENIAIDYILFCKTYNGFREWIPERSLFL